MKILETIQKNIAAERKMLAVLLDPDTYEGAKLDKMLSFLQAYKPDFVFVGGSHTTNSMGNLVTKLKTVLDIPVVLFPGNACQFTPAADALLNISLISGRNAEYLIGQHVTAALAIKKSGIEVIPTGYILVEGGKTSSVEYVSNTRPIPRDKANIAVSTALAGELLGMQAIYLEAGSGAMQSIDIEMIKQVKNQISLPLIVGGGIQNRQTMQEMFAAGADVAVVGNVFETEPEKIREFV